jgi:hypothetical protein
MNKYKIIYITLLLFNLILADEISNLEKEHIFKDRLGFDSGMTNEELDIFKNNYAAKLENLGLKKFPIFYVESYKSKLNLLKIEELKNLGLPFDSLSIYHTAGRSQLLNILTSELIVVGTIDEIEYLYNSKDEELNAKSNRITKYHVKIDEILKGKHDFKDVVNELSFYSSSGKYIWTSSNPNYLLGTKYLMYFNLDSNPIDDIPELNIRHHSSLEIDSNELFFLTLNHNKKSKYIKKFSEMKTIINKYIEINDSENFYNREYNTKSEE